MNEIQTLFGAVIGAIGVVVYSGLQTVGGRNQGELDNYGIPFTPRIWGWFISPIFFIVFLFVYYHVLHLSNSFIYYGLASYLILPHVGYGGDKVWYKILRRLFWAIVRLIPAILFTFGSHSWLIFSVQALICVTVSIAFGVWNPMSAPKEEFTIKLLATILNPFML